MRRISVSAQDGPVALGAAVPGRKAEFRSHECNLLEFKDTLNGSSWAVAPCPIRPYTRCLPTEIVDKLFRPVKRIYEHSPAQTFDKMSMGTESVNPAFLAFATVRQGVVWADCFRVTFLSWRADKVSNATKTIRDSRRSPIFLLDF